MFDVTALVGKEKRGAENRDRKAEPLSRMGLETLGVLGGPLRLDYNDFLCKSKSNRQNWGPVASRIDPQGISKITPVTANHAEGMCGCSGRTPLWGQGREVERMAGCWPRLLLFSFIK